MTTWKTNTSVAHSIPPNYFFEISLYLGDCLECFTYKLPLITNPKKGSSSTGSGLPLPHPIPTFLVWILFHSMYVQHSIFGMFHSICINTRERRGAFITNVSVGFRPLARGKTLYKLYAYKNSDCLLKHTKVMYKFIGLQQVGDGVEPLMIQARNLVRSWCMSLRHRHLAIGYYCKSL